MEETTLVKAGDNLLRIPGCTVAPRDIVQGAWGIGRPLQRLLTLHTLVLVMILDMIEGGIIQSQRRNLFLVRMADTLMWW
jgi:hypothetical protein